VTHAAETSAINGLSFFWRQFQVYVSCKSKTKVIWYQILAPIRTLFYSKPESGVHMTEMIIYELFLFKLALTTIPAIITAASSANSSSTSLSATFILGARNFHWVMVWKTGARKWQKFCCFCENAVVSLWVTWQRCHVTSRSRTQPEHILLLLSEKQVKIAGRCQQNTYRNHVVECSRDRWWHVSDVTLKGQGQDAKHLRHKSWQILQEYHKQNGKNLDGYILSTFWYTVGGVA